jgi:hypothetical protein
MKIPDGDGCHFRDCRTELNRVEMEVLSLNRRSQNAAESSRVFPKPQNNKESLPDTL